MQMGILRSLVNVRDLVLLPDDTVPAAAKKTNGKSGSGKIRMSKSASVSTEINLIGMTTDEAIAVLDKYLVTPISRICLPSVSSMAKAPAHCAPRYTST